MIRYVARVVIASVVITFALHAVNKHRSHIGMGAAKVLKVIKGQ